MAFLGKEYKFVKDENYDGFIKSWGLPADKTQKYENYKPTQKIVLNGDTYTLTKVDPALTKELTFKSGVEFVEKTGELDAKTTFTVDGNTVTQVQKFPDGNVFTFKREYSGDDLVMTITTATWDGVAKRFYKA